MNKKIETLEQKRKAAAERVRAAYGIFAPGSGFGDPDAELQAKMELEAARFDLEQVDAEIREANPAIIADLSLRLQRHQFLTAWAGIVIGVLAAVPGVIALFK